MYKTISVHLMTCLSIPLTDDSGAENTFFALRSCHRLLYSDSGEFFSPDYLCSNPPLWCNWTIQVDPSKRIHLYLEDLTPDDICNLKQDQIHIDEPVGDLAGHKVLQKCWQEAKYTSSSNILYVVLLIGGWPNPLYRGFYGRYQAFGSPVIYNPREGFTETNNESETSPGLMDFRESGPGMNREQIAYGYDEEQLSMMTELPAEPKMPADTNNWVSGHSVSLSLNCSFADALHCQAIFLTLAKAAYSLLNLRMGKKVVNASMLTCHHE